MSGAAGARALITGGGTGGHVYPGLAVAESLRRLAPASEVRFAGTSRGLEAVLVPRAGYRFHRVPASGLRGLGAAARVLFVVNFGLGFLRSLWLLARWRPDIVLGTGGYVSAPVMSAARMLGVACVLQEQNAVPGSANRLVGRWARRVYLGFASAAGYFPAGRAVATGNPVRSAFAADGDAADASRPWGIGVDGARRRVLVFGGSGGARTLNRVMVETAAAWNCRSDVALLLQTGRRDHADVAAAFAAGIERGHCAVVPYIDDMAPALRGADLVVCRAGAMTLAELQRLGKPAILVPFPHATDGHQLKNARDCEAAGAAVVLEDAACDGPALLGLVDELLGDRRRLADMAARARGLSRPGAADAIAADMLHLAGHPAGRPLPTASDGEPHDVP